MIKPPVVIATAATFASFPVDTVGFASGLSLRSPTCLRDSAAVYDCPHSATDLALARTDDGIMASVPDIDTALAHMENHDEFTQITGDRSGWGAQVSRYLVEIARQPRLMTVR